MERQEGCVTVRAKGYKGVECSHAVEWADWNKLKAYPPEVLVKALLEHLGEDSNREGLLDTPMRWIKWMKEFLDPKPFNMTTFSGEDMDEMVIVENIPFYSFCEHHIAPIVGFGTIAYIPNKKIVGLSKLPRTLDFFSNRLQNQERITSQVAQFLMEQLDAKGVAVALTARHFCMEMRGVKKHDTYTTTTKLMGIFKEDPSAKEEFLNRLKHK